MWVKLTSISYEEKGRRQRSIPFRYLRNKWEMKNNGDLLYEIVIIKYQSSNLCKIIQFFYWQLYIVKMISEEESQVLRDKRVTNLQNMLMEIKKQITRKVMRITHDSSNNRRQRRNRKIMDSRVRKTHSFVKVASNDFFQLMCSSESLQLTCTEDIIEKVEKFKKNVMAACQKMMHHFDQEACSEKLEKNSPTDSKPEEMEDLDIEGIVKEENKGSKSKNYKTSNEATVAMTEWLLENFENPYPTHDEKQKMAKKGNISMNKVNNWFINARERTVKGYFNKDG